MATLREYFCLAHGEFESFDGECPFGCSERFVQQQIRTAPGLKSIGTKNVDAGLDDLSKSYGLSDIPSVKEGESVMGRLRRNPKYEPIWGEVKHAEPGWSARGEQAPKYSSGYPAGVNINNAKGAFTPLPQLTQIVGSVPKE